jgi:uncharacterized protein with PQ loop repeat
LLTLTPFVPQYAKFWLRRSADGVSLVTLALIIFSTWLQVLNLLVLHWDEIAFCLENGTPGMCVHSLTTLAYVSASLLGAGPMLPVALALTPPGLERTAGVWVLTLLCVAVVVTGAPVALVLSQTGACASLALYAAVLGASCAVLYVFVYMPQLLFSLRYETAGSLSYGFLGLHLVLGVCSAAQKALGTHERVVTWLPPLSANVMQALIIAVNLHFDLKADGCGSQPAREEAGRLLGKEEKEESYGALQCAGGDGGGKVPGAWQRGVPFVVFSREWWMHYL